MESKPSPDFALDELQVFADAWKKAQGNGGEGVRVIDLMEVWHCKKGAALNRLHQYAKLGMMELSERTITNLAGRPATVVTYKLKT
jgi:hypothetical protein